MSCAMPFHPIDFVGSKLMHDTGIPVATQLASIFAEKPHEVASRLRRKFDEVSGAADVPVVLFGASALGRRALCGLRSLGREPLAFTDNDRRLWYREVDGIRVLPPVEAVETLGRKAVFVVTVYNGSALRRQLREISCDRVAHFAFLYWKYHETFLPFCALASPEAIFAEAGAVSEALSIWSDDASRANFESQLRWHLDLDSEALPRPSAARDTYFPDDLVIPCDDEVFVDCGAFDGDAVRALLERRQGRFRRVVALEPDPANYARLREYVAGLADDVCCRIDPRPLAAASKNGTVFFDARGDVVRPRRRPGTWKSPVCAWTTSCANLGRRT